MFVLLQQVESWHEEGLLRVRYCLLVVVRVCLTPLSAGGCLLPAGGGWVSVPSLTTLLESSRQSSRHYSRVLNMKNPWIYLQYQSIPPPILLIRHKKAAPGRLLQGGPGAGGGIFPPKCTIFPQKFNSFSKKKCLMAKRNPLVVLVPIRETIWSPWYKLYNLSWWQSEELLVQIVPKYNQSPTGRSIGYRAWQANHRNRCRQLTNTNT